MICLKWHEVRNKFNCNVTCVLLSKNLWDETTCEGKGVRPWNSRPRTTLHVLLFSNVPPIQTYRIPPGWSLHITFTYILYIYSSMCALCIKGFLCVSFLTLNHFKSSPSITLISTYNLTNYNADKICQSKYVKVNMYEEKYNGIEV